MTNKRIQFQATSATYAILMSQCISVYYYFENRSSTVPIDLLLYTDIQLYKSKAEGRNHWRLVDVVLEPPD